MKKLLIVIVALGAAAVVPSTPAQADAICARGVVALGDTSCSFALNVANAYRNSTINPDGGLLRGVYSPTTGLSYDHVSPGYADGTGGNAPLTPGYGPTGQSSGYHKTDDPNDPWYGHNGPCNSNDVTVIKVTERGNAIERWGPKGCDPTLPMTGTN